ncbi:MAG: glycosyltransferase family 4 protein [Armatimonadota bacterium]|nr:glycosyltransferase family 4 protein [Armatimonadota bacterium]
MNVGMVSARLRSADGVSIEAAKWEKALERMGFFVYLCAGAISQPKPTDTIVPRLECNDSQIQRLDARLRYDPDHISEEALRELHECPDGIKRELCAFVDTHGIGLLIIENLLSLPLNLPAGIAVCELVEELAVPVIARHHDFYWEREKLVRGAAAEFIRDHFLPGHPTLVHVVINSAAQREFRRRHGIVATRMPNVFDFEAMATRDEYNADFRNALGIRSDDVVFLQPSRIVPRKRIDRSVELFAAIDARLRLRGRRAVLLITGPAHGEREAERTRAEILSMAATRDLEVRLAADRISIERRTDPEKVYSIHDAYVHADVVTFPSDLEGFGNPVIEAAAYRLPLFTNRYPVLADITRRGFRFVEIDGQLTADAVDQIWRLVVDPDHRREITDHNFAVAQRYFAFPALEILLSEVCERALIAAQPYVGDGAQGVRQTAWRTGRRP